MSEQDLPKMTDDGGVETPEMEQAETTQETQGSQKEPIGEEFTNALDALKAEHAELKDKYVRLYAEFDTFRRRMMKEKLDMIKTAAQDTMAALLPVLDDFDRAKKSAEQEGSTEHFSDGVTLVYQKLHNVLKQLGLEAMDTVAQSFDPEWHEAVAEIPAPDESMKGKIIDTVEKGYLLSGKIIRHAKVVIGK